MFTRLLAVILTLCWLLAACVVVFGSNDRVLNGNEVKGLTGEQLLQESGDSREG
jgi:hypothetical protein